MTWHRTLANRAASAALGDADGGTVHHRRADRLPRLLAPARSPPREIRHDYNYAQVLTLSLWGAGIEPVEVPISYRRRNGGRSFVRYPEYFARVAPALLAPVARLAAGPGASSAAAEPAASTYGQADSPKDGNSVGQRPERGVGAGRHEPAVPEPHVEVEPHRRRPG